jgi:hypothetical protein
MERTDVLFCLETSMNLEDILMWPDGTWCYRHELSEMTHMSDDYRVIAFDSAEYKELM